MARGLLTTDNGADTSFDRVPGAILVADDSQVRLISP